MPILETERLLLRPPEPGDASSIARWLIDYEVAKNLATVPYPFTVSDGEALVTAAVAERAKGEGYTYAILKKDTGEFVGACALHLSGGCYKLSYWLGRPYWNHGFASEAARKVLVFAFHQLKADRVLASWFADNPASGRVLEKLGFRPVETYRRESLARGAVVICNRVVLVREEFGRKPKRLDRADIFAEAMGA
jgi:[ribosomal protein S5]-alanine N-acetyltransferase